MCDTDKYNGWTNRETWAVALHINNDQGWQESVHEVVRGALDTFAQERPLWREHEDSYYAGRIGDAIRSEVEDVFYFDDTTPEDCQNYVRQILPVVTDIGSLWRVDWTEIGAAFFSDVTEA